MSSSLWGSYGPPAWRGLAKNPEAGGTLPPSSLALPGRPTLSQILSSKQVRYAASALAGLGLVWLALRSRGIGLDRHPHPDLLPRPPPPSLVPPHDAGADQVDWSHFAYVQYVTNADYLCNSVMIFETLFRLGSRPDRVMLYPKTMMAPDELVPESREGELLGKARDRYGVKLVPVDVQRRTGTDSTWAESFTKLLAFNQTRYRRVLGLDSDGTVLQAMDELFLLPPCPVAMPRAYWLLPDKHTLSSQVMLVQPSAGEFARIVARLAGAGLDDYDMEVVNQLYGDSAMVLPHRPYDLLTGEFRGNRSDHVRYLGSDREAWDPVAVINEAKFLHFSDWPVPKPWLSDPELRRKHQPECHALVDGRRDCTERTLWNGFYDEFATRRKSICNTSPGRKGGRRGGDESRHF